ncbi:MAG: hypothetical protein UY07_C0007G0050 [Parcubacteria group bacterium GW2011_GWA1_47_8]|nr:MAG: hypothetical protein UY07_C0007G0050 [Parcubacteria group bacterium GW2011_GWA1_47_8]KKW07636.1 MAG: hypothetical protein UY42_C0009G0009 [Parcubacteria group bacterium GW2011_GWA2_49_16]
MKNYERGELAKEILTGLATGGFIALCIVAPGLTHIAKLFKTKGARDKYRITQAVRGLQQKKLVRIKRKNGQDVIEITEFGKKRVLAYNLDTLHIKPLKKWDRRWHLITFDIPETQKYARRAVSAKIKEIGMYPLQKSIFVSPYLCKREVDFVGEFFGVRKHIIYIEATDIENAEKVRRHFGIY